MIGLLVALLGHSGALLAGEAEADTAVRTRIWARYEQGYAVRTSSATHLVPGEERVYLLTLLAGNEYLVQGCGDDDVSDLDLFLYDSDGKVVAMDSTDDREPTLSFKPATTDTYYLTLSLGSMAEGKTEAGVAMALLYR